MGIRNEIKKRLPIFGAGSNQQAPASGSPAQQPGSPSPSATRAPTPTWDDEEEPESNRGEVPVEQFIDELVKTNKIVLFMKGSPSAPMCGFSANAAGILLSYGHPIAHFDVLSDPEVRQGIKDYSQWPTLPQVYVGGEFLGGSDILMQMHQSGELKQVLEETFAEG